MSWRTRERPPPARKKAAAAILFLSCTFNTALSKGGLLISHGHYLLRSLPPTPLHLGEGGGGDILFNVCEAWSKSVEGL